MQTTQQIPQVVRQVRFVFLHRDAIDAGRFASLQLAKGAPQQLVIEQREEVIENRFRVRLRSLRDAIQPI